MVYNSWFFFLGNYKRQETADLLKTSLPNEILQDSFYVSHVAGLDSYGRVVVAISLALNPLDIHLHANNRARDIQHTVVW